MGMTGGGSNFLWFLPTHGDRRYLGTTFGARPVDFAQTLSGPEPPEKSIQLQGVL